MLPPDLVHMSMQRDAPCNLSPLLGPPAGTQGASFDVTLEYADPHHTVLLLAYIMRRRTREQVKVGGCVGLYAKLQGRHGDVFQSSSVC
jgi:hypothetical protein